MRGLLGDSQTKQRSARFIEAAVHRRTLGAARKALLRGAGVRIGFPQSAAQAVFALVLDEAQHIAQRITEEKPDFVRKGVAAFEPLFEGMERAKDILKYIPSAKEWFPDDPFLLNSIFIDGSKQRREAGRLLYEYMYAVRTNVIDIFKNITHLIETQNGYAPVKIEIVTSLAGGFGSGMFVRFAKDLKTYLMRNLPNPNICIHGHFIMPTNFYIVPQMQCRDNMNKNAELALEELKESEQIQIFDNYELYDRVNYEKIDVKYVENAIRRRLG